MAEREDSNLRTQDGTERQGKNVVFESMETERDSVLCSLLTGRHEKVT